MVYIEFGKNFEHFFWQNNFALGQIFNQLQLSGGSPGLVVMGEEWRSIGLEFVSQHRIVDGHVSTFVEKFVLFI